MRPALLAALSLALAGCFQMASTLTVRPDGSAVLEESVELSGFAAAAAMESEDGVVSKEQLTARAAALGEGVALLDVKETETGYTARYAVADVRALRFTPSDLDLAESADDATVADEAFALTFEFEPGRPATLRVVVPEAEARTEADTTHEALTEEERAEAERGLRMARALLGDARMTVAVAVEGDIEETDAAYVDGSTVTLIDFTFDALFDAVEDHPDLLRGERPPVDGLTALLGDRDDARIQPPGTVTVRFE